LWLPVTITAPSVSSVVEAKYSSGVGPSPTRSTSIPASRSPSTSGGSSSGDDSRPS